MLRVAFIRASMMPIDAVQAVGFTSGQMDRCMSGIGDGGGITERGVISLSTEAGMRGIGSTVRQLVSARFTIVSRKVCMLGSGSSTSNMAMESRPGQMGRDTKAVLRKDSSTALECINSPIFLYTRVASRKA
jgi:hypothetical protein